MPIRCSLLALTTLLALTGCGAPSDDGNGGGGTGGGFEPDPGPGGNAGDDLGEQDPPDETPWTPPTVIGVTPLIDQNPDPDVVEVTINAVPRTQQVGIYELDTYTYNGTLPGGLLQAKIGDEVIVHLNNYLPEATTIHWHGLRISDQMDGTPRVQDPVEPEGTFTYSFVVPDAGSFWYHPHIRAHEQIERGLYGPLIVHDPAAPELDAERFLLLDDVALAAGDFTPFDISSHPDQMHGRHGNVLLTNGQLSEDARGEAEQGQVERWRVLNTANARTMVLAVRGAAVRVTGSDGGQFFEEEFYEPEDITLPVGQRYDLEVTYDQAGTVELLSYVLALDANDEVVELELPVYRVEVAAAERTPRVLAYPLPPPPPSRAGAFREQMIFDAVNGPDGHIEWRINGVSHSHEPLFTFQQGDVVILTLNNQLGPEHPFHLHGQFFNVLTPPMPGLRDTVLVPGMESVQIIAYFDNPGHWMAHCHILEHAELGMMSEIYVEPAE